MPLRRLRTMPTHCVKLQCSIEGCEYGSEALILSELANSWLN